MATPLPSSFVALRHRNFRLLWAGQLVSFSGTMMQSAAILWHVSLLVELEAGLVANWFGAPLSVVSGGLGCLVVTATIAATTPALRRYRRE